MIVEGEFPTFLEIRTTTRAGMRENTNALEMMPYSPTVLVMVNPSRIATTAPRHAPDEMPVVYGSARGFPVIACITMPPTANPIPAMRDTATVGMMFCHM